MDSYQKRRHSSYYGHKNPKKKRDFMLEPGLKGFMCTCNTRERECVRESFNILNEYADILYAEETNPTEVSQTSKDGSEEEDIDSALAKEVDSLKNEYKKKPEFRRFQLVESGANNCLFIRTTLPDPVTLAYHIMKDADSTKKQKTRFLLRLVPIEVICKAYLDDVKEAAGHLFDKYFSKEGKTFAIQFNRRNSNALDRIAVIEELAEMIKFRHVDNSADLKHAQLTIIVEVIRSLCCLSVIPDYFKLHKYNLFEICCSKDKGATGDEGRGKNKEDPPEASSSEADAAPRKVLSIEAGDGDVTPVKCEDPTEVSSSEPDTALNESQTSTDTKVSEKEKTDSAKNPSEVEEKAANSEPDEQIDDTNSASEKLESE